MGYNLLIFVAEQIDQWFQHLASWEQTLEEMAAASTDQNFTEELGAIEQCELANDPITLNMKGSESSPRPSVLPRSTHSFSIPHRFRFASSFPFSIIWPNPIR